MLLPHEILDCLSDDPVAFKSIMLGNTSSEGRLAFWRHVSQLPGRCNHPALRGDSLESLIPLTLHGDGAQMYNEDEVFIWSVSSLFSGMGIISDVLLQKFPFVMIPERFMKSDAAPGHQKNVYLFLLGLPPVLP